MSLDCVPLQVVAVRVKYLQEPLRVFRTFWLSIAESCRKCREDLVNILGARHSPALFSFFPFSLTNLVTNLFS